MVARSEVVLIIAAIFSLVVLAHQHDLLAAAILVDGACELFSHKPASSIHSPNTPIGDVHGLLPHGFALPAFNTRCAFVARGWHK